MKRGHEGFTLMELVVVIGVVALLAALMLPVVQTARERAQRMNCSSNQRQLAAAFSSYATDWDGILPRWWTPDGGNPNSTLGLQSGERDWAVDVLPYVVNERLYACPGKKLIRGYGFNLWLSIHDGYPVSSIEYPTRTLLITEISGKQPSHSIYDFTIGSAPERFPLDRRFRFDPRHDGGGNIVFADGHVKWVKSSQYTRWPRDAYKYLEESPMSLHARGTPMGTYWWPTAASPLN